MAFAGQQVDAETGLHYNRFRYYDPTTATYTSPDPLGINPNPAAANAYVHNPHTWVDPLGLACPPPNNGDEKWYEEINRKGREGEEAVRREHDIGDRSSYLGESGRRRISDGTNSRAISEVKNVKEQSNTLQLRDGLAEAKRTGREYHLYTRHDTLFTRELDDLIQNKNVPMRRFDIPGM